MLRLASSDDVTLAVHRIGPRPPGLPVLYAHATGFHGRVWEPLARRVTGSVGFAPDLRAHGDSPVPDGHALSWERFADDVLATVDLLQLDRPFGVGHSKGGAALLLAEARRPGTFAGLWIFEPVVFPPDAAASMSAAGGNPLAAGARQRRATFDSFAAAEANFAAKPPMGGFDPEALQAYVTHGFAVQPDGTVTLKCTPEHEAQVYEMAIEHHAWDRLDQVHCPVTVVRGAIDRPGPAHFAAGVAERLPAGRLEVHDDLDHFGPMVAPVALARSVAVAADLTAPPAAS